jgi:hypothetical protein
MFSPSLGVVAYALGKLGFEWNHLMNSNHAMTLIVIAAGWAIAGATLPDRNADLMPAIGLFGAALLMTTVASCRAFPAALAVSMLGMALAAPVGAATVLSIFG